jgi:hypothetical protein
LAQPRYAIIAPVSQSDKTPSLPVLERARPRCRSYRGAPVRIHIDHVPDEVRLVVGLTGTVQIDPPGSRRPK